MSLNKREKIYFCMLVVSLIAGVFSLTLCIKNMEMDKEINNMSSSNLESIDSVSVTGISVTVNGVVYNSLDEMIDLVIDSNEVIGDCKVSYSDGSTQEKECYIVYNTDETEDRVVYVDNVYGKIMLPKSK